MSDHSVCSLSDTVVGAKSTTELFEEQTNGLLGKDGRVNTSVLPKHLTKTVVKFFMFISLHISPKGKGKSGDSNDDKSFEPEKHAQES